MVSSSVVSQFEDDTKTKERFKELLEACRSGDLEKFEIFRCPSTLLMNGNVRLFTAHVYGNGHYTVVSFLLENGAKCESETFEGERCLYGALTAKIRGLLLTYKFTKAVDESQSYRNVLARLYDNPLEHFSDITLKVRSSSFPIMATNNINYERLYSGNIVELYAHRFILCARCPYFSERLNTRNNNQHHQFSSNDQHHRVSFEISQAVDPTCFQAVLRYIYTSKVVQIPERLFIKMVDLCQLFGLKNLRKKYTNKSAVSKLSTSQLDKELQLEIDRFSDNNSSEHQKPYPDMYLRVENTLYPCHRVMLSTRSEYFNILLNGPFAEGLSKTKEYDLPTITLSKCTCEVLELILEFIYTDKCEKILPNVAYELLVTADMFLFDRLKTLAAIVLTNQKGPIDDIYELMRKAIDLKIDRLEQYCCRWFAEHLKDVLHDERFLNLVKESAQSIQNRQATDTIPLIDDLRYWLAKKHREAEYNRKLAQIDAILEQLDLDA
ncbi:9698_t:CDS:2 [Ambispora gerdemannii]|uniref:9698_t:CDS:1 n=1 Tax=Ambispora gerdemannii TaxID=144530 RepID=A0A9N8V9Y8_9GLOM|nr:9698_t:CDS:2 [Ambispora gerdemannii]